MGGARFGMFSSTAAGPIQTAMRQRLFLPLLLRLAVVALAPAVLVLWLAGPLAGGAVALVVGALELWRVDRTVRTGVDESVSYTATPPADLGWLDDGAIRDMLGTLRGAGFQPIADCTFAVPTSDPGFGRLLVHRTLRLYAQVTQTRNGTHHPAPVSLQLTSVLADGRTLATTSSRPHPGLAFGLTATDSWQVRPGASARDLVVEHMTTRERMRGAVPVAGEGTLADYLAIHTARAQRQAARCRTDGALSGLVRGLRWERCSRPVWLDGKLSNAPATVPAVTRSESRPNPPAADGQAGEHDGRRHQPTPAATAPPARRSRSGRGAHGVSTSG